MGGFRTQDGWDDLAKVLQSKGFAVLSFRLPRPQRRTTVDREMLWTASAQHAGVQDGQGLQDKIASADYVNAEEKDGYYLRSLVNDIEAASRTSISETMPTIATPRIRSSSGPTRARPSLAVAVGISFKSEVGANVITGGYSQDPLEARQRRRCRLRLAEHCRRR